MAAPCFISWNAVTTALTAPMAGTATSAVSGTVKTILQIKPGSSKIRIVEWGYRFLTTPAAPVQMELIETGTVFATVTSGSISAYNDTTGPGSLASLGTAATGFNATVEGTIVATRLLDQNLDLSTNYSYGFYPGREPEVQNGFALRVRATPTSNAAVTVLAFVVWEE